MEALRADGSLGHPVYWSALNLVSGLSIGHGLYVRVPHSLQTLEEWGSQGARQLAGADLSEILKDGSFLVLGLQNEDGETLYWVELFRWRIVRSYGRDGKDVPKAALTSFSSIWESVAPSNIPRR